MPDPASVAVIIPCHNGERWVAEAIRSVLDQHHPPLEIIVVDDGSSDASFEIARSFAPRVRSLVTAHCGGAGARNRGLRETSCDYVLFLDHDDYLYGDCIGGLASEAARSRPDVVVGAYAEVDEQRNVLRPPAASPRADDRCEFIAQYLADFLQTASFLWRRVSLIEAGGWNESLVAYDDVELCLRMFLRVDTFSNAQMGDAYVAWRRHDGARVSNDASSQRMEEMVGVLLRYRAELDALGNTAVRRALAERCYRLARLAFRGGHAAVGRRALGEARSLGLRGHVGTALHRLASGLVGLELKTASEAIFR
jgi:glycosyltransferase involved in cell wall biosynthesis